LENRVHVETSIGQINKDDKLIISRQNVCEAISNLKIGKSVGNDLLPSEHFVNANNILHVLLSMLLAAFAC